MNHRPGNEALSNLSRVLIAGLIGIVFGLGLFAFVHKTNPLLLFSKFSPQVLKLVFGNKDASPGDSLQSISPNLLPTLDHRLNILVMGVDSNGKNTERFTGTRSDTIMLVSVDPQAQKVAIVSIPRDSRVLILNGHGEDKINAAHAFGGPELAVATVQEAFSVPIDRYLVIDASGLKHLFEVLGPVDVLVEKKMYYTDRAAGLYVALQPGLQTLDAAQSEEYVRFRHDAKGDIGRIERQQWFLRQVLAKLQEPQTLLKLPDLYNILNECVVTNLALDDIARLASFAKNLKPGAIETATLPGEPTSIKGISYWSPDFEAAALVFNKMFGTPLNSQTSQEHIFQDSAFAADPASPPGSTAEPLPNEQMTILVRYPKGYEEQAKNLEDLANRSGFKVKGRIRGDLADCQHEQIVQNSKRIVVNGVEKLKDKLLCVSAWPTVVNLDPQLDTDITLVLTSQSVIPSIISAESQNDMQLHSSAEHENKKI